MNMIKMYQLTLQTIHTHNPSNFSHFLSAVEKSDEVLSLRKELGDNASINYLQDLLTYTIDEKLVNGFYVKTKDGVVFNLEHLTPKGYEYLSATKDKTMMDKVKNHAKENGVAPNFENITKLIANVMWD